MKNAVWYKNGYIARNSEAYKLYEEKKMKELDAHLKNLRDAAIKRGEVRAETKGEA